MPRPQPIYLPAEQSSSTMNFDPAQAQFIAGILDKFVFGPRAEKKAQNNFMSAIGEAGKSGVIDADMATILSELGKSQETRPMAEKALGQMMFPKPEEPLKPDNEVFVLKDKEGKLLDTRFVDVNNDLEIKDAEQQGFRPQAKGGGITVNVDTRKPPSGEERKKHALIMDFRSKLDSIKQGYKPEYVGALDERQARLAESGVTGPLTRFMGGAISPQESIFRQQVLSLKDDLLRMKSGAQINEQEFRRLSAFLPDPGLDEQAFNARVEGLIKEADTILKNRNLVFKSAGLKELPEGTTKTKTPNYKEMSDEELLKGL